VNEHTVQYNSEIPLTATTTIGICPDYTGDWPPHPYIGDPLPDPFLPTRVYPGIIPYSPWHPDTTPWDVIPLIPYTPPVQPSFHFSPTPVWSLDIQGDRCIAKLDLPGVRNSDLKVEIENGSIHVTAKRFDTGVFDARTNVNTVQFIGADYDPKTSEATLEAGVLTVTILKFKEKSAFSVPVTVK
jgi:HSP20 family molecular chaperone IbpA